jgi:hypothetical protein
VKPCLKLFFLSCLVTFGAWAAVALAQDSMADFGLKVDALKQSIVEALVRGYIPASPDRHLFKSSPPSVQAALVRNTLNWFKTYTETEAFKADYAQQREADRPMAPKAASVDAKYAGYLDEQRQGLEKMKQEVAQMPPDMQKQMQSVLKQMEAEFEKNAKDEKMTALIKESYGQEIISEQQAYQERLADWGKQYPADSKALVAARLRQFLEVSASIAFDAKLVPDPQGRIMRFADPHYEARSREWKLCFRAGREPVQAARAFVGEWLNQIEKP